MTLSVESTSARRPFAGTFEVIPTGRALGAEIRGVDLRDLDAGAFTRVMQAWHDHSAWCWSATRRSAIKT